MRFDYRQTKEGKRRFAHLFIYRMTYWIQVILWKCYIPWHNPYSDECTPDFNCCSPTGEYPVISFQWLWGRHEEAMVLFGFAMGRVDYEPCAKYLYSLRIFLMIFKVEANWITGKYQP